MLQPTGYSFESESLASWLPPHYFTLASTAWVCQLVSLRSQLRSSLPLAFRRGLSKFDCRDECSALLLLLFIGFCPLSLDAGVAVEVAAGLVRPHLPRMLQWAHSFPEGH